MKKLSSTFALIIVALAFSGCDDQHSPSRSVNNSVAQSSQSSAAERREGANNKGLRAITLVKPHTIQWWQQTVTYQIWPRSFKDTNGDGIGDLKGVTEKLPYLKELGVGAIWLTPIFKSPSYHNYDTTDYFEIDPNYGSMEDFDELIKQSKKLGIKIILDLVINHVSDQHPWFIKSINKEPGYEDYFIWSKTLPKNYGAPWSNTEAPEAVWHTNPVRNEWYYSVFGYNQPDLNLKNPAVLAEIKKVASFWLAKGVDGFRLDAVRYLIEEGGIGHQADTKSTITFLEAFDSYIKSQNTDAMLIGEVYADNATVASYYDRGRGIDAAFDFSFSNNIVEALDSNSGIASLSPEEKTKFFSVVREAFWNNLRQHADSAAPVSFYAPFVNNHDLNRLIATANGNQNAARIAAELLLTSPGAPYLYYGEEIGMGQAGLNDDMYRRGIMQWDVSAAAGFNKSGKVWMDDGKWFPWIKNFSPWWTPYWNSLDKAEKYTVAGEAANGESLLALYKQLISLRNNDAVVRAPDKIELFDSTSNAWVVKYEKGTESRWIVINLDADNTTTFDVPEALKGNAKNLLTQKSLVVGSDINLGAGGILILQN